MDRDGARISFRDGWARVAGRGGNGLNLQAETVK
jgi:hypothetical protein